MIRDYRVRWIPGREVKGTAYDTPIAGYRVNTCNTLRLWKAEAVESFDFQEFNVGDYYGAVDEKVVSETVTKVLYPNDEPEIGQKAQARAAVLLRLLLAPGHAADPRPDGRKAGDIS
jgi:glucan phosphorylase